MEHAAQVHQSPIPTTSIVEWQDMDIWYEVIGYCLDLCKDSDYQWGHGANLLDWYRLTDPIAIDCTLSYCQGILDKGRARRIRGAQ